MNVLTEYLLALLDLLAAHGQQARRSAARLAVALALVAAALVVALAGVGAMFWGAFRVLAPLLGRGGAALLLGAGLLALAAAALWWARRLAR